MRTIVAIIAGYALWSLLWLGSAEAAMAAMPGSFDERGVTSSTGILITFLVLSMVLSLLSGACTAMVATTDREPTVRMLGSLLFLTGLVVQLGAWDSMPVWYHLPFLALLYPATVMGARMVKE
jgi:hypothetical protein